MKIEEKRDGKETKEEEAIKELHGFAKERKKKKRRSPRSKVKATWSNRSNGQGKTNGCQEKK